MMRRFRSPLLALLLVALLAAPAAPQTLPYPSPTTLPFLTITVGPLLLLPINNGHRNRVRGRDEITLGFLLSNDFGEKGFEGSSSFHCSSPIMMR